MFVISKMFWMIAAPGNFLLLLLCIGVVLAILRRRRAARWFIGLAVLGFLAAATLPVGAWLITPLENRFPVVTELPARIDGIVVLGRTVNQYLTVARGQPALSGGAERLTAFVGLARKYPDAKLVFTGGAASLTHPELKETLVARQLFSDLGLDTSRVIFEDRARKTSENAILTYALVQPKPDQTGC